MLRALLTGSLLMLLLATGCTALVETDTASLGAAPQACDPGSTNPCPCPRGGPSVQLCNAGGSYDPCACEGQPATAGTSGAR